MKCGHLKITWNIKTKGIHIYNNPAIHTEMHGSEVHSLTCSHFAPSCPTCQQFNYCLLKLSESLQQLLRKQRHMCKKKKRGASHTAALAQTNESRTLLRTQCQKQVKQMYLNYQHKNTLLGQVTGQAEDGLWRRYRIDVAVCQKITNTLDRENQMSRCVKL